MDPLVMSGEYLNIISH